GARRERHRRGGARRGRQPPEAMVPAVNGTGEVVPAVDDTGGAVDDTGR
ncbi:hypothetical protein V3C99_003581, partial [Haemonchus contortus]